MAVGVGVDPDSTGFQPRRVGGTHTHGVNGTIVRLSVVAVAQGVGNKANINLRRRKASDVLLWQDLHHCPPRNGQAGCDGWPAPGI